MPRKPAGRPRGRPALNDGRQVSYRLSVEDRDRLARLRVRLGLLSDTDVVRRAVRELDERTTPSD